MIKAIKTIALTHTPTTNIVVIPVDMVREVGLENENRVLIQLDENNRIIITKLEKE